MPDAPVFISYSRANTPFALKLATALRDCGANIWFDEQNIMPGTQWAAEIQQALKAAGTMVIILSPESIASDNVLAELNYALNKEKRVIPVRIAECEAPYRIDGVQYIDFSGEWDGAFQRLCKALELLDKGPVKKTASANAKKPVKPPEPVAKPKAFISGAWICVLLFIAVGVGFLYYKHLQKKAQLSNLKETIASQFSAGRYDYALNAAVAFADLADKDEKGIALLYRGKSRVMSGITRNDAATLHEGLNDLAEVESSYHNDAGTTKYFAALGSYYLADYRKTIDDVTLLVNSPLLRQMGYETVRGYNVYNLRGEAYMHLNNKDRACADFQEGMKANDSRARINFSASCQVWQMVQPSATGSKVLSPQSAHLRTISPAQLQLLNGSKRVAPTSGR